jgi:hypothetical protein
MPRLVPAAFVFPFALLPAAPAGTGAPDEIRVRETDDQVQIDTDALQASVNKKGYVSGIAAGSFGASFSP